MSYFSEAEGLERLRSTIETHNVPYLHVPKVLSVTKQSIELQRIQRQTPSAEQWQALGTGLAVLHNIEQEKYGLEHNNFIGLNTQVNTWSPSWGEFFLDFRLKPQVAMLQDTDLKQGFMRMLASHGDNLVAFLDQHCLGPSLLHGDLWHGNVLFDADKVYLIDPAVYFGDSEADLAMTELFGGFHSVFYRAYREVRQTSQTYSIKREIYNLYHNLNHLNLFGSGYVMACRRGMTVLTDLSYFQG